MFKQERDNRHESVGRVKAPWWILAFGFYIYMQRIHVHMFKLKQASRFSTRISFRAPPPFCAARKKLHHAVITSSQFLSLTLSLCPSSICIFWAEKARSCKSWLLRVPPLSARCACGSAMSGFTWLHNFRCDSPTAY